MKRVASLVNRVGSRRAVKHVSWMMGAQGINLAMQAVSFALLARLLGAYQYGIFSGAFAVVNTLAPYAIVGTGMLFMRYVTLNPEHARTYWGNAVVVTCTFSFIIAGVLYFIGPRFARVGNGPLFIMLALAYCLFSQIVSVAVNIFQTLGKIETTALITVVANAARLFAVVVMFFLLHRATALQWAVASLAAGAIPAIWVYFLVQKQIGTMRPDKKIMRVRLLEGLGFSFAGTTQAVYNDIDKMILSRDGYVLQNGAYSLAYRIVDFATSPVAAVDTVVMAKFFALSKNGIRNTLPLLYRSLLSTGGVSLAIAVCLMIVAPFIPQVVGRDYAPVSTALIWLAPLPFMRSIHRMVGGVLTGSGHQNMRTIIQLLVSVLNAILNLILIPGRGWIAAAWVSLISDGLLALLSIAALYFYLRRSPSQAAVIPAE